MGRLFTRATGDLDQVVASILEPEAAAGGTVLRTSIEG
jgi:hypothetical protein